MLYLLHSIESVSESLHIQPPQGARCLSKLWLDAAYRCLWHTQVWQPGCFSSLSPYLELSRLALYLWERCLLCVCSPGPTDSVDPPRVPPIRVEDPCMEPRSLALRREGAPKLWFLSGLSCDRSHTQGISPSAYKIPLLDGMKYLLYSLALKLPICEDSIDCSGWLSEDQLKIRVGVRSKWTQLPATQPPSLIILAYPTHF